MFHLTGLLSMLMWASNLQEGTVILNSVFSALPVANLPRHLSELEEGQVLFLPPSSFSCHLDMRPTPTPAAYPRSQQASKAQAAPVLPPSLARSQTSGLLASQPHLTRRITAIFHSQLRLRSPAFFTQSIRRCTDSPCEACRPNRKIRLHANANT